MEKRKSKSKPSTSESSRKKTKSSSSSGVSASSSKITAKQLFGSDSEGDDDFVTQEDGKKAPLLSYINRRVANGYCRQLYPNKSGKQYIELKIYNTSEIEKVSPMNRWRQAIVTIKSQTNTDTEAWRNLSKFIKDTREEYKSYPPTFIGTMY